MINPSRFAEIEQMLGSDLTGRFRRLLRGQGGSSGGGGGGGGTGGGAVTFLTAPLSLPNVGGTVAVSVGSNAAFAIGQQVFIPGIGVLTVIGTNGTTGLTLQNNGAAGNAAPNSNAPAGATVTLSGPGEGEVPQGRQLWVAVDALPGGTGDIDAPFQTIDQAFAFINAQASGGWSIKIEPGLYPNTNALIPGFDRIQIIGSGVGETILQGNPATPGVPVLRQVPAAAPAISSLEIRDLQLQSVSFAAAPALVLDGSAQGAYFSGDGYAILNVLFEVMGNQGQAPIHFINAMGGTAQNIIAGDLTIDRAGAQTFAVSFLGNVMITGSSLTSQGNPNPVQFLAGTEMFSLQASGDATGAAEIYLDATSVVFGLLRFNTPNTVASNGTYCEVHGDVNQIIVDDSLLDGALIRIYDFRDLRMGTMGSSAVGVNLTSLTPQRFDFRGADLDVAPLVLTGPVAMDIRKGFYTEAGVTASGASTLDRDLAILNGVSLAAGANPETFVSHPHVPNFPAGATYTIPQPELVAGTGSFIAVSAKTPLGFTLNAGAPGTYNVAVLRNP